MEAARALLGYRRRLSTAWVIRHRSQGWYRSRGLRCGHVLFVDRACLACINHVITVIMALQAFEFAQTGAPDVAYMRLGLRFLHQSSVGTHGADDVYAWLAILLRHCLIHDPQSLLLARRTGLVSKLVACDWRSHSSCTDGLVLF